ncbi:peptidylprolyl isomerase [Alienimonas chondri]|uniref:peptidylprolyl isomerase n=1 Tax=Alienimonas chondri TaxID=2681879 RepID=A0ABX1VDR1_9PLAN|nr:peptidylprolyl isomerase [Alienimonas chondri]NNJ25382.1 hypothetical protein [Alienimonas chondri]
MHVPRTSRFPSRSPVGLAVAALACVGLLATGCIRDYEDPNAPSLTKSTDEAASADEPAGEDAFRVKFETTKGPFVVEARPDWAPLGAARFKTLVEEGFFDGAAFFRVIPGFVAQFGLAADPAETAKWKGTDLRDEPVLVANTPGRLSFAKSGPNTRTTQMFINLGDNSRSLDPQGFSPFAEIVSGGDVPAKFHAEEVQDQGAITSGGAEYLEANFPDLDTITSARIIPREEWVEDVDTDAETAPTDDEGDEEALAGLAGPEGNEDTTPAEPAEEAMTEDGAGETAPEATEEPTEPTSETPTEDPADESADETPAEPAMTEDPPPTPPEPSPSPDPEPDTPPTPDPTPDPGTPPEPQPDPTPTPDPTPDPEPEPEPQPDPTPDPEEPTAPEAEDEEESPAEEQ